MKKILTVVIVAAMIGLSTATRAWLFHESPHEVISAGMFGFVGVLVIGIGVVMVQRKQ
jgi:hypothetical protein